ncbi:hypothetical protein Desaci_1552 [Desulfosporosinus acidiphilus SJ4]|uniref:Uncharacterized protein n=1 Tax=Desulfosporosinus acidiphilus (strain DSM 22704 / JCM 16185 / SJ4) TaxID=646529 RepID=I4D432_DESAJ|nr:hypothetical protein [Desulfosporosinus acidiphilus]AFM40556.1 hypothetical protein Desaci_1552 [Desulfosporosinus acidiphilus SJ4]
MQIITSEDMKTNTIKILINEFLVTHEITSKESISIELLNYLRNKEMKIEDGVLFNQLLDLIEEKVIGLMDEKIG